MVHAKVKELFSIDYGSLAVFRIALALLIIFDLINRARELTAHYTDFGVLPRAALIDRFSHPLWISIHLISGDFFAQ